MENKKPTHCNHCKSSEIMHHVWGRTEFYSCLSCKKEVTYQEEPVSQPSLWKAWDPKEYGFSPFVNSNQSVSAPSDAFIFDDSNDSSMDYVITLPKGITVDISKYFKGN